MASYTRTLRVQFPVGQWSGWYIAELNLQARSITSLLSPDSSPPPTPQLESPGFDSDSDSNRSYELCNHNSRLTLRVDPDAYTDYGSDSPVFRAFVVRDRDDYGKECRRSSDSFTMNENKAFHDPKTPIALKFALREDLLDDLAQEAEVYQGALCSLQGDIVPQCYGFFTGIGSEGQKIACLALEYWGESLQVPFRKLPIDVRIRILDSLGELHKCGLHHGDFAERNVLMNDNDIRLIDFDQPVYHDCDCETTFQFRLEVGKQIPDVTEFGCPTLWEICRSDMGIWG
ncbi:MAG: hypothetical protein NXY57DRAFT_1026524 [Lentinula lateritia]|nr:MAG: hypothetical protein NXY57DRAFT_1026524 [Lentinula lateritia]